MTVRPDTPDLSASTERPAPEQRSPAQQSPSIFDFDLENTSLRDTPAGVLDEMTPRAIDTLASNAGG